MAADKPCPQLQSSLNMRVFGQDWLSHLREKLQMYPIILIFSTFMGYDHSLEVETIEIYAHAFFSLIFYVSVYIIWILII